MRAETSKSLECSKRAVNHREIIFVHKVDSIWMLLSGRHGWLFRRRGRRRFAGVCDGRSDLPDEEEEDNWICSVSVVNDSMDAAAYRKKQISNPDSNASVRSL